MNCPWCGHELCERPHMNCYDPDPPIDLENGRRLNLHAERISRKCWLEACTRRAKTRVALARFRRAAREKQKAVTP